MYHSQLPPITYKAIQELIDNSAVRGVDIEHWCGNKTIAEWISYCFVFSLYDNNEEVARELLTLFLDERII